MLAFISILLYNIAVVAVVADLSHSMLESYVEMEGSVSEIQIDQGMVSGSMFTLHVLECLIQAMDKLKRTNSIEKS